MAYRSNLVGKVPPTATDDVNKGYRIGSRWIDKTHNRKYTCTDATNRAAIWIEDYADVTDQVSVAAAGAVMESYTHPQEPPCRAATAAQTGHATAAQITKLDGIETGATKYPDTGEQAFLDADHTKLNGIDTGATDDQTGAEIKTAYEAEANAYTDTKNTKLAGIETGATKYPDTGEQAFLDADHTKLNGIETGADVTDTTNVLAAGSKNQISLWRRYISPGSDIAVGTIPANSFIHRVWVHVTELFNDSGTDILIVGIAADPDKFGTALDVSSTGVTEMNAGVGYGYNASSQDVTARYSCQNYNVNQGKALVIVEYEIVGAQP